MSYKISPLIYNILIFKVTHGTVTGKLVFSEIYYVTQLFYVSFSNYKNVGAVLLVLCNQLFYQTDIKVRSFTFGE